MEEFSPRLRKFTEYWFVLQLYGTGIVNYLRMMGNQVEELSQNDAAVVGAELGKREMSYKM